MDFRYCFYPARALDTASLHLRNVIPALRKLSKHNPDISDAVLTIQKHCMDVESIISEVLAWALTNDTHTCTNESDASDPSRKDCYTKNLPHSLN